MSIRNFISRILGIAGGHAGKGVNHYSRGKYSKAIESFEKAIKIEKKMEDNWIILAYLGRSHLAAGEYKKALPILQRAYEKIQSTEIKHNEEYNFKQVSDTLDALRWAYEKNNEEQRSLEIANVLKEYKEHRWEA